MVSIDTRVTTTTGRMMIHYDYDDHDATIAKEHECYIKHVRKNGGLGIIKEGCQFSQASYMVAFRVEAAGDWRIRYKHNEGTNPYTATAYK